MLQNLIHDSKVKGLRYFFERRGFARASMTSLANSSLNRVEYKLGRQRLISNPDYTQIEPTTSCNLTCGMCGLQTGLERSEEERPATKTSGLINIGDAGSSL